jgi:non-specific serine/threonine protein kinase
MPLAALQRLGPYEIVALLGSGGMGEVYRAHDGRLDRDVAIKVLPEQYIQDSQALARFHREVKAVANLSHPNIVAIYDFGTDQNRPYAVMELLEGQTLGARLRERPCDWREAVELAAAIADGLAAAHAKGIVHRDIKPENVFLTASGSLKILDFGLARMERPAGAAAPSANSVETTPGMLLGTVLYMSPEQVRGLQADARSDIFALGCVLYKMVTGRCPFDGQTSADTMAAILQDTPPALSGSGQNYPPELQRIVNRCLEKNAERRYQSAKEVAATLRQVLRFAPPPTGTQPPQQETAVFPATPMPVSTAAGPSIAVLPFRNLSSDPENEYFSDGLAEELINVLSKVEGLHVAARTSAFAFKNKSEDVRKIGDQLGVRTVLEGSVRKSGQRLRISAQLVSVADGFQLWSETFNRELKDVFEIQDEIAQSIARALRVILGDKAKQAMEKMAAADVQAYDLYLRGLQYMHQLRCQGYEFALKLFGQALQIDPTYARAQAGVSLCYTQLYHFGGRQAVHLQQADLASRKALELDPGSAEAHVARGLALSLNQQNGGFRQEFEEALRIDPQLFEAYYFYGRALYTLGDLKQAATMFEQAFQLRPDDYQSLSPLAAIYRILGRDQDARTANLRAFASIEKHLALHPDDVRATYLGAISLSRVQKSEQALEWANRALQMSPNEVATLYAVACVYAVSGAPGRALDCLEQAVKNGYSNRRWLENDGDLLSLHQQPRWQALVASMK